MDIEALVKKHISRNGWSFAHDGECAKSLRAALTEQAADYERAAAFAKDNSDRIQQEMIARLNAANERIRQLEAERDGMALVPRELLDKFPELNTSNYSHDDVDELNAWGIELVLAAAPQPKKEGE